MAWFRTGWRPTREANPTAADSADVRRFARNVAAARVAANVGRNVNRVLVGTLAGAGPVGLYQNAYQWSVLPVQQVHQPLLNVALSTLSKLRRRDAARYHFAVGRALLLTLTVTMPAAAFLLVEARPAVLVLLGAQWVSAVPLFRLLSVAAFATGPTAATKWVYLAEGLTGRQLRWTLVSTPVMLATVASGAVVGKLWGGESGAAFGTAYTAFWLILPGGFAALRACREVAKMHKKWSALPLRLHKENLLRNSFSLRSRKRPERYARNRALSAGDGSRQASALPNHW